jgi:hypothetical protein
VPKKNQRDPNLRAATVARVNQLVKGGLTKAAAFEKISAETGRARDAVQMLYYRAIRAGKGGTKAAGRPAAGSKGRARRGGQASGNLPTLLNGIASAINELLKHLEKTTEENRVLREQTKRLHAIASLVRGK